jgi:hypothetical protein
MQRYIIQRNLGEVTDEQVETAAKNAKRVREEQFPDVVWEHSHIVRTGDGLVAYCVYGGPNEARLREHAAASGLPADDIWEISADLDPASV